MASAKKFETLSTNYVNLASFLRHLRQQNFMGLVRVAIGQYEAEVRMNGPGPPVVAEIDSTTRQTVIGEGAMERLLVHAQEPGGAISVYDNHDARDTVSDQTEPYPVQAEAVAVPFLPPPTTQQASNVDWADLLESTGKLIGAIEQAVRTAGADFDSNFLVARIELGDDYTFIDPTGNGLTYADKTVVVPEPPAAGTLVTAISECLRRVVDKVAIGKESKRFRETVAIELAVAARLRPNGLGEFTDRLDRIAGTKVLNT